VTGQTRGRSFLLELGALALSAMLLAALGGTLVSTALLPSVPHSHRHARGREDGEVVRAPTPAFLGRAFSWHAAASLLVASAFGLAARRARHVADLARAAERLAAGDLETPLPASGPREVVQLVGALERLRERARSDQEKLARQRSDLEASSERLERQDLELRRASEVLDEIAVTDGLTRLPNHRAFRDELARAARRQARTGESLSVLIIDVDDFKELNTSLGHASGDLALRRLAAAFDRVLRAGDVLARWGGEEFAVLAPAADLAGAAVLAERVRLAAASVELPGAEGCRGRRVSVSVGVAEWAGDPETLLRDAERAVLEAKQNGKDCVAVAGDRQSPSADA
jgi:diguanylate cyclase